VTSISELPSSSNKNHPPAAILSPHHAWTLRPLPDGCWRATPATGAIRPGRYRAIIVEATVNEIPTGEGLHVVWKITNGRFAGRSVDQFVDYIHRDQKIQRLAQEQIKALCDAAGVRELLTKSERLVGGKSMIRTALVNCDEAIVLEVIAGAAAWKVGR
jgi:hypothetical protein